MRTKETAKEKCRQCRRAACCHGNSPSKVNGEYLEAVTSTSVANGRSPTKRKRGAAVEAQSSPKRKKVSSSRFYGVRFRQDLQKWVSEIRVQQWKLVDKKVWLGTFYTEEGAARGVDLARKLLGCNKPRGPNLPCKELDEYSGQIPDTINLSDIKSTSMFKEATTFIKRRCQEYAAQFAPTEVGNPNQILDQIEEIQECDVDFEPTVFDAASPSRELTVEDYCFEEFSFLTPIFDQIPPQFDATTSSSCLAYQGTGVDELNLSQSTASSKSRDPVTGEEETLWPGDTGLNAASHLWGADYLQYPCFLNPSIVFAGPILGQDPPAASAPWDGSWLTGEGLNWMPHGTRRLCDE